MQVESRGPEGPQLSSSSLMVMRSGANAQWFWGPVTPRAAQVEAKAAPPRAVEGVQVAVALSVIEGQLATSHSSSTRGRRGMAGPGVTWGSGSRSGRHPR